MGCYVHLFLYIHDQLYYNLNNFFLINLETSVSEVEETFRNFTSRSDICIILINQNVSAKRIDYRLLRIVVYQGQRYYFMKLCFIASQIAEMIRHVLDRYEKPIPAVLEIPSKDHPYDPTKDSILRRAKVSQ